MTTVITSIPVDNSQPLEIRSKCDGCWRSRSRRSKGRLKQAPLNAASGRAADFCSQMKGMYPFDPTSLKDDAVDQFYFLVGRGDAWKKLNDDVKPFVLKVGIRYAPNPTATVKPSPDFLPS